MCYENLREVPVQRLVLRPSFNGSPVEPLGLRQIILRGPGIKPQVAMSHTERRIRISSPSPVFHRLRRAAQMGVEVPDVEMCMRIGRILTQGVPQYHQLLGTRGKGTVLVSCRRSVQPSFRGFRLLRQRGKPGEIVHRQRIAIFLCDGIYANGGDKPRRFRGQAQLRKGKTRFQHLKIIFADKTSDLLHEASHRSIVLQGQQPSGHQVRGMPGRRSLGMFER